MPRRLLLSSVELTSLYSLPDNQDDLIRYYTFSEPDFSLIRQRRGDSNRLGFAVQLCLLRYPGFALAGDTPVTEIVLNWIAQQLRVDPSVWPQYGNRDETRREHFQEISTYLGLKSFGLSELRFIVNSLTDLAMQTDKGVILANRALAIIRQRQTIVPTIKVIERICSEAITRANRRIYRILAEPLTEKHREVLDNLLELKPDTGITWLIWLRQSPLKTNSKSILEHIERLKKYRSVNLPEGLSLLIHQNRLLKISREGQKMTPKDLGLFEDERKYATLVAITIEGTVMITDELIELHDRIMMKIFGLAKKKHKEEFHSHGKEINDKVMLYSKIGHALMEARRIGQNPFKAIESVLPWEDFTRSVTEADGLAQPESFDHIHLIADQFSTLRRYTPEFLEVLEFRAAPAAQCVLDGIDAIKRMNREGIRKVPEDAPKEFIKPRWRPLVFREDGIDHRYYEICALTELKNSLRSGDVWVVGSRQFKDFEEYLLPVDRYLDLKRGGSLTVDVNPDYGEYMESRLEALGEELFKVNRLALADHLPDATITENGLKISPQDTIVPDEAQKLIDRTGSILPRIKITNLLQDVEDWTGFTRHFLHLKDGEPAMDKTLLLTVILSDAINLGLYKMAESCQGMTYAKLSGIQAWHIRDETYSAALAELVNAQYHNPFAEYWGNGTTSSSDGQRFRAGGRAENSGQINPKYGSEPGRLFYTHISDQYSPFNTKVINVGVRDSTYVLDGLLYHESDLRIEEHYTDTAGFTDHVFALMHLLGFRFAPRIRDLKDTKIYIPKEGLLNRVLNTGKYEALNSMIGGYLNIKSIHDHWDDILRLAESIKQGTVTASLMIRKLGSYPRQNGLAVALRELGRIERTLFILDWLQNIDLRRRGHAGLNKGEARNALARAVFFNRLGEIRDRSFEQQRYRASGLNLVTAAIVLWNTVYLERAIQALKNNGICFDEDLLQYLSPLGWEHINLTGDYVWQRDRKMGKGEFRPLRMNEIP
jgi:TnpA family transposase